MREQPLRRCRDSSLPLFLPLSGFEEASRLAMGKVNVAKLRYMSRDDFRVLTAVRRSSFPTVHLLLSLTFPALSAP